MATNNPSVSSNAGKGFGSKVRGVFEVIHGFGDSVRGTFLGAIDTMVNRSTAATRNDEIAREGRLEIQRGMQNLGRRPVGVLGAGSGAYNQAAVPYTQTTGGFKRPERAHEASQLAPTSTGAGTTYNSPSGFQPQNQYGTPYTTPEEGVQPYGQDAQGYRMPEPAHQQAPQLPPRAGQGYDGATMAASPVGQSSGASDGYSGRTYGYPNCGAKNNF